MIYIDRDSTNTILTRFFDKRKNSDSYFIWEVTNTFEDKVFRFVVEDTSNNPSAYNLFKIKHSSIPLDELPEFNQQTFDDLGVVMIDGVPTIHLPSGHNYYKVYETTDLSLNNQYVINTIESDILFVELDRDSQINNGISDDIYY